MVKQARHSWAPYLSEWSTLNQLLINAGLPTDPSTTYCLQLAPKTEQIMRPPMPFINSE